MVGIHGSYFVIYIVGIILMIVNLIQSICRSKGKFFNPSELEERRDEKTFIKIRALYGVSQTIMLILFVICFVKFKNYVVAIVGLFVGNILPIALVYLYDFYLNMREKREFREEWAQKK